MTSKCKGASDPVARVIANAIRSKNGYSAAFYRKNNAVRFITALKAAGYKKFSVIRSGGPVVDVADVPKSGKQHTPYYITADWC